MEEHGNTWKAELTNKESDKQDKWSEHCKTFLVKDAHGAIKELVFPKALDLDRPKRERTVFSNRQLSNLEEAFRQNQYLVGKDRTGVAKRLGLSETQVKVWFQNRRTKHKKDNERCGGGKDLQAESKAAQNVLKLLEYKTALRYNTLLNSTATDFDRYTSSQASSNSSVKCHISGEFTDHLGEVFEKNVLQEELLTSRKSKDTDFESPHEKTARGTTQLSILTVSDVPWVKDLNDQDTSQTSTVSISKPVGSQPYESATCLLLREPSTQSPAEAFKTAWDASIVEHTHSQSKDLLNSARPQLENLSCLADSCHDAQTNQNANSSTREELDHSQPAPTSDYHPSEDKSRLGSLQTHKFTVNKEHELSDTSHYSNFFPVNNFTHPTVDVLRDYWRHKTHGHHTYTGSGKFPIICPDRPSLDKSNGPCCDEFPSLNKIQDMCSSGNIENDIIPNSNPSKTKRNIICYQAPMPNTCLAYQQTTTTSAHASQQHEHVPYGNIKHFNYYAQNIPSPSAGLRPLQYMPVYHTYGGGCVQTSNSVCHFGTPPSRYVTHQSLIALPRQYHGYPITPHWNQTVPGCYQTE